MTVRPSDNKYPFCLCWTPYPGISSVIPILGHVGVGDADGVTHDFNGFREKEDSSAVSVGEFSYSRPYKYHQLGITTLNI